MYGAVPVFGVSSLSCFEKAAAMAPKGKSASDDTVCKRPSKADEQANKEEASDTEAGGERTKMSGKNRDVATAELEAVLEEFRKKHKKEKPDFPALKKALKPSFLQALWQRLKRERANGDMSLKQAWEAICSMKLGSQKKKQDVLMQYVLKPDQPEAWQGMLMGFSDEISKKATKIVSLKPLTKGQLIQQHGYAEAMDHIQKGKYREITDEDGDTLYVRRSMEHRGESAREQKNTLKRTTGQLTNWPAWQLASWPIGQLANWTAGQLAN